MYKLFGLLIITLLSTSSIRAQSLVRGTVVESNETPAIGAEVVFYRQGDTIPAMSTFTDANGDFEMILESGIYQAHYIYLDYKPIVQDSVRITDSDTFILNLVFEESLATHLEAVIVTATARNNNIVSLYSQQQHSTTIGDGISADVIAKSSDRSTGDVLKRVSGASVQDNKYVVVRGMNDRYNIALVDGAVLPSTEPNRKAFSFDIIPSALLDQIIITKSGSADLPGDYAGGALRILTKDIPNKPFSNLSLGTGFNSLSTFQTFRSGKRSSTDFLGFDNGLRQLPLDFPDNRFFQDPRQFNPNNKQQSAHYLGKLNNDYTIYERSALPSFNAQWSWGNRYPLGAERILGILAALNYAHDERVRPDVNRQYGNFNYNDDIFSYQTHIGAILNLGCYAGNHKILFKSLYNKVFDDRLLERTGHNFASSKSIRYYAFDLQQKSLLKSTLSGEYKRDPSLLDWNIAYNWVSNLQSDQRKITYAKAIHSDDQYAADITNLGKANNRLFGSMHEHILGAGVNYSYDFNNSKMKVGIYEQARFRNFNNRYLGAVLNTTHPSANDIVYTPLEHLFDEEHIQDGLFQLVDQTSASDAYFARTFTTAAYGIYEQNLWQKLQMQLGIRLEHYFVNLYSDNQDIVSQDWWDILPSVNLKWVHNEHTNIRATYFRSLVRPELREMANLSYYDYEWDAIITGNPNIEPTRIHNIDFRFEHFPNPGEAFSVSIFYKHFANTIENNLYGSNSAYDITVRNFKGGYNLGAEIELRKGLEFIGSTWKNFNVYVNASWVYSRINLPENYYIQGRLVRWRPLTGQAPWTLNAGVGYSSPDGKFGLNLLYNYIGQNLYMVGNDILGHVYVHARHVLDLTMSYQCSERLGLKLGIKDLTNSPYTFYMDQNVDGKFSRHSFEQEGQIDVHQDWLWQEYRPGISLSLSANWKLY